MNRTAAHRARRSGFVAAAMLVSSVLFGFAFNVTPAQAHCGGLNSPGFIFAGNPQWGHENARNGFASTTCDGDRIYRGNVYDDLTDGSCVTAQYSDAGQVFNQATSCDAAGLAYTFFDQNGNSSASVRLCRNQGCGVWWSTFGY